MTKPSSDNRPLKDALAALEKQLEESKGALGNSRIEGKHYFLDQALGRYLWGGIAAAEAILALVHARQVHAADALKRQLHETVLDLYFILSSTDPDLCAAQSALRDLEDWRELWTLHQKVTRVIPDFPFPPIPEEWQHVLAQPIDADVKALDEVSAELGGPPDLFSRAKAILDAANYWHWSGMSRVKMIAELKRRGQLDEGSASIAQVMTKLFNVGSHASPSWSVLNVDIRGDIREHVFPDTTEATDADLVQFADTARHLLQAITQAVSARVAPNGEDPDHAPQPLP